MPIDDRTTNRSYQLPNAGNLLLEDVLRLRAALQAIDADIFARYTKLEVDQLITNLIAGAPGALNTLDELAAALGDDANFAATVTNQLALKANASAVYTKAESDARYVQGSVQTEMVFVATANQSVFTLSTAIINKPSALVTVDGVVQPTAEYSLNQTGTQLTLSEGVPAGTVVRVLALGVASQGAPADDTVTTPKLRDGAVTTEKLASGIAPTVVSLNGGQLAGMRNLVINGAMAVDQERGGAAQTFTAGAALAYCVDQWYGYCAGANVTGQQVQGASAGLFRYRFTGAAGVTAIGFGQRIEQLNSAALAGTTATLSVDLANSVLTTVTWTAFYANTADTFGTLASPTRTQIATGTFTVNSTVTRYSTQITIPAAATTGIEILFTVGAQTSGTWTIGDVQLEPGSVATPFERRSYSLELALCLRHYEKSYSQSAIPGAITSVGAWLGIAINGAEFYSYGAVVFRAVKRTAPTITLLSPGDGGAGVFYNYTILANQGNAVADNVGDSGFRLRCSNNAMAANNAFGAHWIANARL